MARGELLSVLGLYEIDNSIFNQLVIPSELDKDVLINNILLDCAELEVLYPNPNVLKSAIGFWSKSRIKSWNDMKNVLFIDNYSPLSNNDIHETSTNKETRDLNTKGTESLSSKTIGASDSTTNSTTNSSGTNETTSSSTQDLDSTTTNKVSAFNSSNFENKEQSIVDSTTSTSGGESQESNEEITNETTNESNNSNTTTSSNTSNIDEDGTILNEYDKTISGFKSVYNLTKQKIIKEEMEIRELYDLYRIISDEFKMKFCLLIY